MRASRGAVVWLAAAGLLGLEFLGFGVTSVMAQQQKQDRPPARIRVRPLEYPGPNAVRQCQFWLAQEYRPSGTVIVPRERCWWERG